MERLVANYQRISELADDVLRMITLLELGDSNHLRRTLGPDVTGSQDLSDACAEFESEWSFGRDRLSSSLKRLAEFLQSAAKVYEDTDVQLAIAQATSDSCRIPETNHAHWWKSLSPSEQGRLIQERSSTIGNLEGIPPEVRYRANANAIHERIEYLRATGADPEQIRRLESYLHPDSSLAKKIDELRRSGADQVTIARLEELWQTQQERNPPRNILVFDPSGDGRIAEVHGSLKTADNIAVFVPGISNEESNFEAQSNSQAQNLYAASRADTAVISWLGYDTPSGPSDAFENRDLTMFRAGRAETEAHRLVSLTEGLAATTGGSVTIVAHSYGTVLTTFAAQQGMSVDKIILVGSPGVPADNVQEYNGAEVFTVQHVTDYVSMSDPHGDDPTSPQFGATVLQGNGDYFPGIDLKSPHGSYFDTDSIAITNIMSAVEGGGQTIDGYTQTRYVDDQGVGRDVYLPKF